MASLSLLLGVAFACGGRSVDPADGSGDEPNTSAGRGSSSSAGGKSGVDVVDPPVRAGRSPSGGTTSQAGRSGSAGMPTAGIPTAGMPTGGNAPCNDVACSDIDLDCEPGSHVGLLAGECCPQCLLDEIPPCAEAMKLYEQYRNERIAKYQSEGCNADGTGCFLFQESNRCAVTCGTPIPRQVRDFIEEDLGTFASLYCVLCPEPVPSPCPQPALPICVSNACEPGP